MSKSPDTRKQELLIAAEKIFRTKGVEKATVSDIVREANVAQGTFYNYYGSKESVFVEVLNRLDNDMFDKIQQIKDSKNCDCLMKLMLILRTCLSFRKNDGLSETLHNQGNEGAHLNYIVSQISRLHPIITEIIKNGVNEKQFHVDYPEQTAKLLLTANMFAFDPGIFNYTNDDLTLMFSASFELMKKSLGIEMNESVSEFINILNGLENTEN